MEDELYCPIVDISTVSRLIQRYYGFTVSSVTELKSHHDRNFLVFCYSALETYKYVLKIISMTGDQDADFNNPFIDSIPFMAALKNAGFVCPVPVKGLNQKEVQAHTLIQSGADQTMAICLLPYIPGTVLFDMVPLSHTVLYELGTTLGEMHIASKNLDSPGIEERQADNEWCLENFLQIETYIDHLDLKTKADLVREVVREYRSQVLPIIPLLEKGIVHGDFHDENIVLINQSSQQDNHEDKKCQQSDVTNLNPKQKYGIFDFGDVCYSAYLFDLATSLAFFMISASVEDFISHGGHFLAGYQVHRALDKNERIVLFYAVCCAYCRELVLCEYDYKCQKGSNDYLLTSSRTGWDQLKKLRSSGKDFVDTSWDNVAVQSCSL